MNAWVFKFVFFNAKGHNAIHVKAESGILSIQNNLYELSLYGHIMHAETNT